MKQRTETEIRRFFSLAIKLFLLLSAVYWLIPPLRKPLVREDNLLEMITALLFLATAIMSIAYIRRRPPPSRHWSEWCVPALATLGFLEEVSFGRLFFDQLPVVHGVKIDALHDYLRVGLNIANSGQYDHYIQICLLATLLVTIGTFWIARHEIAALSARSPLRFCAICLALVATASMLDLELIRHHYMLFLEEFLETLAAIALWLAYRTLPLTSEASLSTRFPEPEPDAQNKPVAAKNVSLDAQPN